MVTITVTQITSGYLIINHPKYLGIFVILSVFSGREDYPFNNSPPLRDREPEGWSFWVIWPVDMLCADYPCSRGWDASTCALPGHNAFSAESETRCFFVTLTQMLGPGEMACWKDGFYIHRSNYLEFCSDRVGSSQRYAQNSLQLGRTPLDTTKSISTQYPCFQHEWVLGFADCLLTAWHVLPWHYFL